MPGKIHQFIMESSASFRQSIILFSVEFRIVYWYISIILVLYIYICGEKECYMCFLPDGCFLHLSQYLSVIFIFCTKAVQIMIFKLKGKLCEFYGMCFKSMRLLWFISNEPQVSASNYKPFKYGVLFVCLLFVALFFFNSEA